MATKKTPGNLPIEKLQAYKKLIDTNPNIELKAASIPYTSYNGHMFSYFERDDFLKKYKTTLFVSYGIVKKEFVLVPDKLLFIFKEFKPYFDISFRYVQSLKAK